MQSDSQRKLARVILSYILSLSHREPEKSSKKKKLKKNFRKSLVVKNKALTFAPAFKNESNKFFEILINNTSSTSKKIEPSILVLFSSDTIKTNRYLNKVNKFTAS